MILKRALIGLLLFIVLQCSIAIAFQDKFIFLKKKLPDTHVFNSTYAYDEYTFTRLTDNGEAVSLNALYYFPKGEICGVVFYLHGTLGNLQTQEKHLHDFLDRGYAVFVYDYRTYGKSKGVIHSEEDLHEDANWMFERCMELTNKAAGDIVVAGRSLGTGMAVPLAAKYQPKKLLLITPYWQIADVAKRFMPYMPKAVIEKGLHFEFQSGGMIDEVTCPTYVFHGTLDLIVPYKSGRMFEEHVSANGCFVKVPGARHSNISKFDAFQTHLDDILSN
jgi:uncharacterized protein